MTRKPKQLSVWDGWQQELLLSLNGEEQKEESPMETLEALQNTGRLVIISVSE